MEKLKNVSHLQPAEGEFSPACGRKMAASWTSRNMAARKKDLADMVGIVTFNFERASSLEDGCGAVQTVRARVPES